MKTISEKLREHALESRNSAFWNIKHDDAWKVIVYKFIADEIASPSRAMTDAERRMFCLFVAEALEAQ